MDGVWEALRSRLDYARFVPTPVAGIERSELRRRNGSKYTVLKNPYGDDGAGTYVQLEPADVELFELMDGKRDVTAILVEHLQHGGYFALDRLARLSFALTANGFFGEPYVDAYAPLRRRRAQRDPLLRLSLWMRRLIVWNVASWANAERVVNAIYAAGARVFFTRVGAALTIAFATAGLVLWALETASPRHDLFRVGGSYTWGILVLALLQVLSISIHELGHALAIRHFGRRVRRLGVAIYYLFPCMYVDSTDMVLEERWKRVVVALAGPLAGVTVASACMVAVVTTSDPLVGNLAFKAAALLVFQFVLNLLPILDLDGYHVLVDALDAPLLRQRAIGFVRAAAMRKIRRREKWTAREIGLALYGGSALAVSVGMLFFALWLWDQRVGPLARELLEASAFGPLILAILVVVFIGPLIVALIARGVGVGRTAVSLARARAARRQEREKAEQIALLSRVRFLNGLPRSALAAIADHLREERFEPGDLVVTAGDPADRFYVIRAGRLEVTSPEGARLGAMIPGEGFGELALLDNTTRTATVRAIEPTVLWSLGRGTFNRWIKDRFEIAARIRSSDSEREKLATLPFFSGLGPAELSRIAAKMVTTRHAAGSVIFRAGDQGERFYVIREGEVEVSRADGSPVRLMRAGETFGDLALLFGRPRTMTLTAVSDVVLGGLGRNDFAALVRASGETLGQFRTRTAHWVDTDLAPQASAGLGAAIAKAGA